MLTPLPQVCGPNECHTILDEADEGDADEVKGSDAVYEFVGKNPRATEAKLFQKCFTCHCTACREPSSVSVAFDACPNLSQTGRWRRAACHRSRGAAQRAAKKRDDVAAFAKQMEFEPAKVPAPTTRTGTPALHLCLAHAPAPTLVPALAPM